MHNLFKMIISLKRLMVETWFFSVHLS